MDVGTLEFPRTRVKTECRTDATPDSEFCSGFEIFVVDDDQQNSDARLGVAHGVPVLDGYFAVDVASVAFMGIRGVGLEPRTREQALADQ